MPIISHIIDCFQHWFCISGFHVIIKHDFSKKGESWSGGVIENMIRTNHVEAM